MCNYKYILAGRGSVARPEVPSRWERGNWNRGFPSVRIIGVAIFAVLKR